MTTGLVTVALLYALHVGETDLARRPGHGDVGRAHGPYQGHVEVIQDVNKIYGTHWVLSDFDDPMKAPIICTQYLNYWGGVYWARTGRRPSNMVLSRIWNGGPRGYRKSKTLKYWNNRVKPYLTG